MLKGVEALLSVVYSFPPTVAVHVGNMALKEHGEIHLVVHECHCRRIEELAFRTKFHTDSGMSHAELSCAERVYLIPFRHYRCGGEDEGGCDSRAFDSGKFHNKVNFGCKGNIKKSKNGNKYPKFAY